MIEALGTWLVKQLLAWVLRKAETEAGELLRRAEEERQRGIRDAENARRYQDAQSRAERARAAIDLLNRNSR